MINKIKKEDIYFDGIELIAEEFSKECPECYAKFYI